MRVLIFNWNMPHYSKCSVLRGTSAECAAYAVANGAPHSFEHIMHVLSSSDAAVYAYQLQDKSENDDLLVTILTNSHQFGD